MGQLGGVTAWADGQIDTMALLAAALPLLLKRPPSTGRLQSGSPGRTWPHTPRPRHQPELEWEIRAAKAAGAVFIYLMDSGVGPLLPDLNRLALDCLKGIDPATAGGVDLAGIRRALPGKSIWGGISGPMHLGLGSPADVEGAVEQAFRRLRQDRVHPRPRCRVPLQLALGKPGGLRPRLATAPLA